MFSDGSSVHIWAIFHFVLRSKAFFPSLLVFNVVRHKHFCMLRYVYDIQRHRIGLGLFRRSVNTLCVCVCGCLGVCMYLFPCFRVLTIFAHFQYQYQYRYTCHAYEAIIFCGYWFISFQWTRLRTLNIWTSNNNVRASPHALSRCVWETKMQAYGTHCHQKMNGKSLQWFGNLCMRMREKGDDDEAVDFSK